MPLGAHVRKFREKRKWDQATLAEKADVGIGTISALEVRDSKRSDYASALAAAFGVTMEQLFSGNDPLDDSGDKKPAKDADQRRTKPLSPLAMDIAKRWESLSEERREWFRDMIFTVSYVEERFPAMRKGAPRGENYPAWEARTAAAFEQLSFPFANSTKPK